jgi:hypothetical protein
MIASDPPPSRSRAEATDVTLQRERVVLRRRRPRGRHRSRQWAARSSRKRRIRTAIICVSTLLLMAAGLYLQLSRQDRAPGEGHLMPQSARPRVAVV